jgi:uncharacterized protein
MSQTAKAQEPSMEEILASIRRIIADDDAGKQAKPAAPAVPEPTAAVPPRPPAASPPGGNSQAEIDAMLADLDVPPRPAVSEPPAPPAPPPAAAPPSAEVLELTEAMTAPPPSPPAPSFRTIDASADVVFADRPHEAAAESPPRAEDEAHRQYTQAATPERALLSSSTVAAVNSAFNSLAHTVLGANARTLEDLVKEMLRPMLKAWLDDNLPNMVERIVRAEIERVSRGR